MPIILGVNKPQYSAEELEAMRRRNEEGVMIDGKHYTLYEATQRQRILERSMRSRKRRILIDDATGDKERLQADQIRLVRTREEYHRFSEAAGLREQWERAEAAGFSWKHGKAASSSAKAIEKSANMMYDLGSTKENVDAWLSDRSIRKKIGGKDYPLLLHQGRQNKHIQGSHEYNQYVEKLAKKSQFGPSRLTIEMDAVRQLVQQYHGTGILLKDKNGKWREIERITVHPDKIGVAVNNLTGAEADTTVFTIRYSKDGFHIVPDYPSRKGEKAKQ